MGWCIESARCAYSLACQEANKLYSQAHGFGACFFFPFSTPVYTVTVFVVTFQPRSRVKFHELNVLKGVCWTTRGRGGRRDGQTMQGQTTPTCIRQGSFYRDDGVHLRHLYPLCIGEPVQISVGSVPNTGFKHAPARHIAVHTTYLNQNYDAGDCIFGYHM